MPGTSKGAWSNVKRVNGYRSGQENSVAEFLIAAGVTFTYEKPYIRYTQAGRQRSYKPDFTLANRVIVEVKGRFLPEDRTKHLLIKQQHPELDIRFVFTRAAAPINTGSKTTAAMWCARNGFLYADKLPPLEWIR